MQTASQLLGHFGAKPEDWLITGRTQSQHRRETRGARPVIGFGGGQFMQAPAGKTPAKRRIERFMAGRNPVHLKRPVAAGAGGQLRPEHRKMVNRLEHCLFLICSQLR